MENSAKSGNLISDIGNPADRLVWDDLRALLAVARHGTLSEASLRMGIGIATLSRRIERLETALALPVFQRSQTGYQLTEEGAALIEQAEAMEAAAHNLTQGAQAQARLSGKVRLATAENLATALILPYMPRFRAAHPDIMVEIVTDIATANLQRRDADLALRMVKPQRGNLTLRRLGTLGYGLYASAEYAARRKPPAQGGAYDDDALIGWDEGHAHLPAATWVQRQLRARRPALTTTSLATQIAATKAGLGLAVLPHFLAKEVGLICVQADLGVDQPIWLVIHSDLTASPRVRALADFLADLVAARRDQLRGP